MLVSFICVYTLLRSIFWSCITYNEWWCIRYSIYIVLSYELISLLYITLLVFLVWYLIIVSCAQNVWICQFLYSSFILRFDIISGNYSQRYPRNVELQACAYMSYCTLFYEDSIIVFYVVSELYYLCFAYLMLIMTLCLSCVHYLCKHY